MEERSGCVGVYGGGGDDPQQTGLMELEFEHKFWPSFRDEDRNAVQLASASPWQSRAPSVFDVLFVFRIRSTCAHEQITEGKHLRLAR